MGRVAARQHGNVTRQALLALGLSDDAIAHRVAHGRLHRVHLGVYAVGRPPTTALERAAAAVLACGTGAALSHRSAGALWGFIKPWPTRFDVTVSRDRRPKGIRTHSARTASPQDFTRHLGIRVTTPARTLLDCAPPLTDPQLARAVNDALLSNYLKPSHLGELLARSPRNHPGAARLAPFIEQPASAPTRSELEDAFLAFCGRYDLPRPKTNAKVAGYEVDALFEAEQIISSSTATSSTSTAGRSSATASATPPPWRKASPRSASHGNG
jgi:Transcriptional regulator, AbiEi antitoxin